MNPSLLLIPDRYKASKLYSQIPDSGAGDLSFTRVGDTATRVNSAGLIEKVRTNLLLRSEEFDNSYWIKQDASTSANVAIAPNGLSVADSLTENTADAQHRISGVSPFTGNFSTPSQSNVFSVYAKNNGRRYLQIAMIGGGYFIQNVESAAANFDLELGTVTRTTLITTAKIENVGNGWYRLSIQANTGAGGGDAGNVRIALLNDPNTPQGTSPSFNYVGDGVSSVFLWGAQLETGDVATPYIPTTTAAVSVGPIANIPRIDYTGGGCGKLLLEPQSTNLLLRSEEFDNAYWGKSGATVTADAATSPDGTTTADLIYPSSSGSDRRIQRAISVVSGTTYTLSVFVKASGLNWIRILEPQSFIFGTWFNLSNGTIGTIQSGMTADIKDFGNGWYRCSITRTVTSTTTGQIYIQLVDGNGSSSVTANGSDGILFWGAQLEVGSVATSYIPTLNATVTRGADVCSKTGISSLIGQTEGTLFAEVEITNIDSDQRISISESFSNRIALRLSGALIQLSVVMGGAVQASIGATLISVGNTYKIAGAYKANDFVLYVNGAQVGVDTSGIISGTLSILATHNGGGSQFFFNPIKQLAVFPTRLSNAELQTLTTL